MNNCPYCKSTHTSLVLETQDYFLTQEKFNILTCQTCLLTYTSPRPALEKIGSYYESEQYISHNDSKSGIIGAIYKMVRKYALFNKEKLISKYTAGKVILDFGCGSGAFLNYLNKKDWKVTGVEYDDKTRDRLISETQLKVDKDTSKLTKGTFDIITTWHVLEHVYELQETLENLNSLLKPSGKLIIAVPNHKSHDAKTFGKYWAALDVPRHLYHFDMDSIKHTTSKAGFKLLDIKPMIFDSFYISLVSTKYQYGSIKPMKAFCEGLMSNLKANKRVPNHSSLIYILEKIS